MDHPSVRRQQLWDAMESCRAGADDLNDPQFADLAARLAEDPELRGQFQRLQQADEAIEAAFADVPIPAGLADRVRRRLADATPAASSEPQPTGLGGLETSLAATVAPTVLRKPVRQFSRRRLLAGFAALSAAAALLAAVWIQTHLPRQQTPASVLEEAMDFFNKDDPTSGKDALQWPPPAEYPISRDVVQLKGIRWRHIKQFMGGSAVAYDLPPVGGGRATLYVAERNVPGLPSVPPSMPLSTGGKSAAAWQAGNSSTLYVLVVEGDAGMYFRYLDHSQGPLT